jgi:hypothetical protein
MNYNEILIKRRRQYLCFLYKTKARNQKII